MKLNKYASTSLLILTIIFFSSCGEKQYNLPLLGDHIINEETGDTTFHVIPEFSFYNQDSVLISNKDLDGKVYVVDFFFTSCPTICPRMADQLKRIQIMTKDMDNFAILSHTVDPERDTPERLKQYGEKMGADFSNWHFLNGKNEIVYKLGMDGYYLSMGKKDDSPGGFIHSPKFILIDQNRHIRGLYNGTDAGEVATMFDHINYLLAPKK